MIKNQGAGGIIHKKNSATHTWGDGCFVWHFLNENDVSISREEMGSGTSEALHFHNNSLQFFYILKGRTTLILEGVQHKMGPNQGIQIAPEMIHSIKNITNQKLEFLAISVPHSHGDKVVISNNNINSRLKIEL